MSISAIVWDLKLNNPPAILASALSQNNVNTPVPNDVAFVALITFLKERGITLHEASDLQDLDRLKAIPSSVVPYLGIIRSQEFKTLLSEYSHLVGAGYPEEGAKEEGCALKSRAELQYYASNERDVKDEEYYKDPVYSIPPSNLEQWGTLMQWPMNEFLHTAVAQKESELSCTLTNAFMKDLLTKVISFAAKDAPNAQDAQDLFAKCRVPAMQLLLNYFGFRVYANEPRVLTFGRLVEYFVPCADIRPSSLVFKDEVWADKINELKALDQSAKFSKETLNNVAGAWVRYRKVITCAANNGSGCPTNDDVTAKEAQAVAQSEDNPAVSQAQPVETACEKFKLENLNFNLEAATRYEISPNQVLLDTVLDKGLVIPLKLGKVNERWVRNFALAFNLGGLNIPLAAVTTRIVNYLSAIIKDSHFLKWWLLTKGYSVGDDFKDDNMYKTYVLHHVCEQGKIGNPCDVGSVRSRAEQAELEAVPLAQPPIAANTVLFQIPNSGFWRRLESSRNSDTVLVFQALGKPDAVPLKSAFVLIGEVRDTPFEQLIERLAKERYAVYSSGVNK